jgi:transposase-like protein
MTEETEILRQDRLGRVRVSRERREALLEEYDRSGMSGADFARFSGIKYPTLANWLFKRREAQAGTGALSARPGQSLQWVEAIVADEAKAKEGRLIIHLDGGARIEVSDETSAALAAAVLRHLAGGKRC